MRITKVEYLHDYKLKLTFSDKKIKVVDLEDMIKNAKGIFLPLKDLAYFKQVALDDFPVSICWPNGADICPDVLYKMGKDLTQAIKPRRQAPKTRKPGRLKIRKPRKAPNGSSKT